MFAVVYNWYCVCKKYEFTTLGWLIVTMICYDMPWMIKASIYGTAYFMMQYSKFISLKFWRIRFRISGPLSAALFYTTQTYSLFTRTITQQFIFHKSIIHTCGSPWEIMNSTSENVRKLKTLYTDNTLWCGWKDYTKYGWSHSISRNVSMLVTVVSG